MDNKMERQSTLNNIQRNERYEKLSIQEIQAHRPYMDVPDIPEEESGSDTNESVSSCPTSDDTFNYDDDDFENSEDNDNLNDYLDEEDENSSDFIDLECGVKIQTSTNLSESFKCFKVEEWMSEDKNNFLNLPSSNQVPSSFQFVTEIFKVKKKNRDLNGNNPIYNKNEKQLNKKEQCEFSIDQHLADQFCFKVPIKSKFTKRSDLTDFYAWICCKDRKWIIMPVQLQGNFVQFTCCQLDSFVILTSSKNIDDAVDPIGTTLTRGDGVELKFEKGCVDTKQNFQYQVHRQDEDFAIETNSLVWGGSAKVMMKYEKSKYTKPWSFTGTLNIDTENMENGSDFEDVTVKLVVYKDNKPVLHDTKPKYLGNNKYEVQIPSCDGVAIIAISRTAAENSTSYAEIYKQIGVLYGEKKICKLMLFYRRRDGNSIYFISECCPKVESEHVKRKHEGQNHRQIFESDDVFLPPQQRIRIHPLGSVAVKQIRPSQKVHNFLFFMYVSKNNTCAFSVQLNRSMSSSPNAIIEFSADNQHRGFITKAEFNIDILYNKHKGPAVPPLLSRVNTLMGDEFKTPRTMPLLNVANKLGGGIRTTHNTPRLDHSDNPVKLPTLNRSNTTVNNI